MIHNFHKSLKKGQAVEAQFLEKFKDRITQHESGGKVADFSILRTGKTIELKTDFYHPDKTPNFALELFSYGTKAGGPFQSQEKGVDFFVYQFAQTGDIYCFEVGPLVAELKRIQNTCRLIEVPNHGFKTTCLLVPRGLLSKLNIKLEDVL